MIEEKPRYKTDFQYKTCKICFGMIPVVIVIAYNAYQLNAAFTNMRPEQMNQRCSAFIPIANPVVLPKQIGANILSINKFNNAKK